MKLLLAYSKVRVVSDMTFEERGERLVREIDSLRPVVEDVAKSLYETLNLGFKKSLQCRSSQGSWNQRASTWRQR